jgi:hypothetical protein
LIYKRPPQLWRYTGWLKRMSAHVDQFVAPSRFTARMHAELGFPRPVAHLPNFIDVVDQDWRNPGPSPQAYPYFLFVGRLELIKDSANADHDLGACRALRFASRRHRELRAAAARDGGRQSSD